MVVEVSIVAVVDSVMLMAFLTHYYFMEAWNAHVNVLRHPIFTHNLNSKRRGSILFAK